MAVVGQGGARPGMPRSGGVVSPWCPGDRAPHRRPLRRPPRLLFGPRWRRPLGRDPRRPHLPWPAPCRRAPSVLAMVPPRGPGRSTVGAQAWRRRRLLRLGARGRQAMGGVLEHPAYTHAWAAHGLADPPAEGWQRTIDGAWVCQVEQGHYGHPARKATWLYAVGVVLPELRWGPSTARDAYITGARLPAMVSWCSNHTKGPPRPRLRKRAASATPPAFRDVLLAISRRA